MCTVTVQPFTPSTYPLAAADALAAAAALPDGSFPWYVVPYFHQLAYISLAAASAAASEALCDCRRLSISIPPSSASATKEQITIKESATTTTTVPLRRGSPCRRWVRRI